MPAPARPTPDPHATGSHPFLPDMERELRKRFARVTKRPQPDLPAPPPPLAQVHWRLWGVVTVFAATAAALVGEAFDVATLGVMAATGVVGVLASRRWPLAAAAAHALVMLALSVGYLTVRAAWLEPAGTVNTLLVAALPVFSLSLLAGSVGAVLGLVVAIAAVLGDPSALPGVSFLAATLALLGLHLRSIHRELVAARELMQTEALSDPLTGLGNLRAFEQDLVRQRAQAERLGRPLLITLWDLDGLKQVNDRLGHPAGDAYLARFAQVVRTAHRHSDSWYRLGGDEFAGLHLGPDEGSLIAARTRAQFPAVSVGWTVANGRSDREARQAADERLYADKDRRRAETPHHIAAVLASLEDA